MLDPVGVQTERRSFGIQLLDQNVKGAFAVCHLDELEAVVVVRKFHAVLSTFLTHFVGFGAEIGISTQKLHARGPMGLSELTSTKYIIRGNGQIR